MSATALKLVPRVTEKQCAQCGFILPLDQFGVNAYYLTRGARDGRSIYCKGCVRDKVYTGRAQKKEMRTAIFWSGVKRTRYVEMLEWLEDPMVCSDCMEWYSVKSRTANVCRDCESKAIANAAKQVDPKAMSIAELASWMMSGQRPHRYKRAWVIQ